MTTYSRFCYTLLWHNISWLKKYFIDIRNDIRTADMSFTLDEYLSMAVFTTFMLLFVENIILSFIFGLFFSLPVALSLSVSLSFTIAGFVFFLFYSYPATMSRKRADDIDKVLPLSVSYMSAIASGNTSPYFIFRTLSRMKEYGEVSKCASAIAGNIKIFGMNLNDAIKKEATKTPSKSLRELLWGINATISSGGDLRAFLREKSDILIGDYMRRLRKYSQDLSMFVEIYLTVIIVGSIFFIVLTSIIGGSGGLGIVSVQSFMVFIFLPLASLGFIALIRLRSPVK